MDAGAVILAAALLLAAAGDVPIGGPQRPTLEQRASYGPIRVCIGDYALRVTADEAATGYVRPDGTLQVVILQQHPWRGLRIMLGKPDLLGEKVASGEWRAANGVRFIRHRIMASKGYRAGIPGEAVWSTSPARRVYELPAGQSGVPLTVDARSFTGADRDAGLLDRIEPRGTGACATLAPPTVPGTIPLAATLQPGQIKGPARVCSGGLAIDLLAGETFKWHWGTNGGGRGWWLQGPSGTFDGGLYFERYPDLRPKSLAAYGVTVTSMDANYAAFVWPERGPRRSKGISRSMGGVHYANATPGAVEALLTRISIPDPGDAKCFEP